MPSGHAADDRRRVPRLALLAAIGAAHVAAIWLLLQPSATKPIGGQPALVLFDVIPPPPPPAAIVPPSPPPPPAARRTEGGGGSPGRRRERAARMADTPAAPMREAMDVTAASIAPLPPPALLAGTVPIDLGRGGADGVGTGAGSGSGVGDGPGKGAGDGSGDTYVRADWLETPGPAVWRRNWPSGRERLAQAVTIRLTCKVRRSGRPYACKVRSEQPANMGFAATALAVLRESRIRPVARNGRALWDVPVHITLVADAIETAPRIAATSAASAPRAR